MTNQKNIEADNWVEFTKWASQPVIYCPRDFRYFNPMGWEVLDKRCIEPGTLHETQTTTQIEYFLKINEHNYWKWHSSPNFRAEHEANKAAGIG